MSKFRPRPFDAREFLRQQIPPEPAEVPPQVAELEAMTTKLSKLERIRLIQMACMKDPWYFISNLIKTVDEHEKTGSPIKSVPPWPHIRHVVKAIHANDIILIEKSRQVFITWTVLAYVLWYTLHHSYANVFVQSKKHEEACELVSARTASGKKFSRGRLYRMYDALPSGLFPEGNWLHGETTFTNGSTIRAIASGEQQIRQYTVSLIFVDEAARVPELEDTWAAIRPSIEGGGKVILATTPKGKESFYRLIETFRGSGTMDQPIEGSLKIEQCPEGVSLVTLYWHAVPGRDEAWYARAVRGIPAAKARQEYDIDYGVFEGQPVYPEFKKAAHVVPLEPAIGHPIYRGWDFGVRRAAVVFAQLVGREFRVLHTIIDSNTSTKMLAERVMTESDDLFKDYVFEDFCDPAGVSDRIATGVSSVDVLESFPFNLSLSWTKSRIKDGLDLITKLIQENRLRVSVAYGCNPLVDGFVGGYGYPEERATDLPAKDGYYDHIMDALRYIVTNVLPFADDKAPVHKISPQKQVEIATRALYKRDEMLRKQAREVGLYSGRIQRRGSWRKRRRW